MDSPKKGFHEFCSLYKLSTRSTNILLTKFKTLEAFIGFPESKLSCISNCGKKTEEELKAFRDAIFQLGGFQEADKSNKSSYNEHRFAYDKYNKLISDLVFSWKSDRALTVVGDLTIKQVLMLTPIELISRVESDSIIENDIRRIKSYLANHKFSDADFISNLDESARMKAIARLSEQHTSAYAISSMFQISSRAIGRMLRETEKGRNFESILKADDWGKQLSSCINLPSSQKMIIMRRYGAENATLQALAIELHVSRERVRQIEKKAVNRLVLSYIRLLEPIPLMRKVAGLTISKWNALSRNMLSELLVANSIIEEQNASAYITVLCAIAKALMSDNSLRGKLTAWSTKSLEILAELPCDSDETIGESRSILGLSGKSKRELKRRMLFSGAVTVNTACEILGVSKSVALRHLNSKPYIRVLEGWYTRDELFNPSVKRKPILYACLKIIDGCGSISFGKFYEGVERFLSRYHLRQCEQSVFSEILQLLGFEVTGEIVNYKLSHPNALTKSEKVYIKAVTEKDGVASFGELAEAFTNARLSLATLSGPILSRSPVVDKTDKRYCTTRLYIIRGAEVQWKYIEAAIERNQLRETISSFSYMPDGTVEFLTSLNSWGLYSGVIGASRLPKRCKSISRWVLGSNRTSKIVWDVTKNYLYGFRDAFRRKGIKLGAKVAISFDLNNKLVEVRQVDRSTKTTSVTEEGQFDVQRADY